MSYSASDAPPPGFEPPQDEAGEELRVERVLMTRLVTEEALVYLNESDEVVDVFFVTEELSWEHGHVLEKLGTTWH